MNLNRLDSPLVRTCRRLGRDRRPAFSMVELMIALALLGVGLLIIGAALPVAMMKTRETNELAVGDAATFYGADVLASRLRLVSNEYRASLPPGVTVAAESRLDSLFRPREVVATLFGDLAYDPNPTAPANELRLWEPFIKVRPLVVGNVYSRDGVEGKRGEPVDELAWLIEAQVEAVLSEISFDDPGQEYYPENLLYTDSYPDRWLPPALPVSAMVYPSLAADPVDPGDRPFTTPEDVFDDGLYERFPVRSPEGSSSDNQDGGETMRALERQVVLVAFYRRLAYDRLGGTPPSLVVTQRTNPRRYEIIIVAVRRTTEQHAFPVPDVSNWDPVEPDFVDDDTLLPTPVLVEFNPYDEMWLEGDSSFDQKDYWDNTAFTRPLSSAFQQQPPATLTFLCTKTVGDLLPPESIFIPAVNDRRPSNANNPVDAGAREPIAGFVPAAPDELPIYRVLEREETGESADDDFYRLTVENNGHYPWVDDDVSDSKKPEYWPVWVIPPASRERDSSDYPVFEKRSPIIGIERRVITLPEVMLD